MKEELDPGNNNTPTQPSMVRNKMIISKYSFIKIINLFTRSEKKLLSGINTFKLLGLRLNKCSSQNAE